MEDTVMKTILAISSTLLLALTVILFVGCDQDGVNGPIITNPSGVASIELRLTHNQIRGFSGDIRSEQVTAIALDPQGVAVPGVEITFAIQSPEPWKGTLSPVNDDGVTDENGQIHATYSIVIDRTTDVTIEAYSGQVSNHTTISIVVVDDVIGSLSLEASRRVLMVPPNQTRQTMVTASLVDTDGNALPGMQVRFRTNPAAMGFVDSDTGTTDYNGRATRNFTSIVNKYGACEITAQVGEYIGRTTIDIRSIEAPAFINLSTTTPVVKVATGQDAQINLAAVVTDSNRVGIPGANITFEVLPLTQEAPTFGSLSSVDTTDDNGRVTAVFNSLGSFGKVRIRAAVLHLAYEQDVKEDSDVNVLKKSPKGNGKAAGMDDEEIADEIVIEIKELYDDIGSLTLRAIPQFLNLPPDSNGMSNVYAQVRDVDNIGISNVKVNFSTDLGTLSEATLTDNAGMASVVFRNNYESGVARITASISGTRHTSTTEIDVRQSGEATGSLTLTSDRESIYADDGLTTAILTALLSDEDGQALSGREIVFTKTHGTVNSPVVTDSLGIAQAVFRDVGLPSYDSSGDIVPAVITAKYDPLDLQSSVMITILPRNPVSGISLRASAEQMTAGSGDSTNVRATCFLSNGGFAPAGTLVRFETDIGHFTEEAVPLTGSFGVAETKYVTGNVVGRSTLRAFVHNDDENVYSNEVYIDLLPGRPSRVTVNASPDRLITNDPDSYSTITAVVSDTVDNPVLQGTLVRFSTTLGNITPSAITDSDGHAEVRLTAGVEAGLAEVTASVQTGSGSIEGRTTVTFVSGRPNMIELFADPLSIAAAGTGNRSTSTIRAEVRDANGNLVEGSNTVVFELLNEPPEPQGCDLNNHGQIDSSLTSNGRAVVSLNAGTQTGGKLIKAYTWRDDARNDTVAVVLATVAVVSGPPFQLDLDLNDRGLDAEGGAWRVQVSARVYDIHRNPVADNIPVVFTVWPDIASITAGHTGNEGSNGRPEPGLAYASMTYHSSQTFSPITITAEVASPRGTISGSKEHILPLQEGELELHIDPVNWMFERVRPNDPCLHRIWVVLKDGHQILINNAPILFTTDRAKLYWMNMANEHLEPFFPDPARKYTGEIDQFNYEEPGQATVYLQGVMRDFFLNDLSESADVQINASVEGYPDVRPDPGFVFITRR